MREKWQKQMPLMAHIMNHPQSQELETISAIMDAKPTICERILQDLNGGKEPVRRSGANGMSAEQVLRCAIVKILFNFTYEELAFHIVDSHSLRWFCRIGIADEGYQKSALNSNIKRISAGTWELINRDILGYAKDKALKKAERYVRTAPASKAISTHRLIRVFCGMPYEF
jgi:transposase, IS5 family